MAVEIFQFYTVYRSRVIRSERHEAALAAESSENSSSGKISKFEIIARRKEIPASGMSEDIVVVCTRLNYDSV